MEPMLAHSAAATIGGKMLTWHHEICVMSCRDCIPCVTPLLLVMANLLVTAQHSKDSTALCTWTPRQHIALLLL